MGILSRSAFTAFLVSLVIGLAAGIGTRFHWWTYETGLLRIFPFCPYAAIAGIAFAIAWALLALFTNVGTGAAYAVTGLVGSLAIVTIPIYDYIMVEVIRGLPPIHDISTDTEHPPPFVALLHERKGASDSADYDGPKLVKTLDGKLATISALQKKYYSDIRSVGVLIPPAKLYARALNAAKAMDWQIVAEVPSTGGGRIEATKTTLLFGVVDDIVIRVKPAGIGARLDIRSKSREGENDLGQNAENIRSFVKKLQSM
jgi:hypothetical protein